MWIKKMGQHELSCSRVRRLSASSASMHPLLINLRWGWSQWGADVASTRLSTTERDYSHSDDRRQKNCCIRRALRCCCWLCAIDHRRWRGIVSCFSFFSCKSCSGCSRHRLFTVGYCSSSSMGGAGNGAPPTFGRLLQTRCNGGRRCGPERTEIFYSIPIGLLWWHSRRWRPDRPIDCWATDGHTDNHEELPRAMGRICNGVENDRPKTKGYDVKKCAEGLPLRWPRLQLFSQQSKDE